MIYGKQHVHLCHDPNQKQKASTGGGSGAGNSRNNNGGKYETTTTAESIPVATMVVPAPPSAPVQPQQHYHSIDESNFPIHGHGHSQPPSPPNLMNMESRNPMVLPSCPVCQQPSRTRIRTYPSWSTWLGAGITFIVFWPLCWVPLVVDTMKQTDHYCVLCGALVGRVRAYQDCCVETRG